MIQNLIDQGYSYTSRGISDALPRHFEIELRNRFGAIIGNTYRFNIYKRENQLIFQGNSGNGEVSEEDKEWLIRHYAIKVVKIDNFSII